MVSVELVIPVLNEERGLPACIETLRAFCNSRLPEHRCHILVADNGSTDGTVAVAERYARQFPGEVGVTHLDVRGRGRALRKAWGESPADVLAYMDVDLSTDLAALPPLVDAIANGGYHVAIGSRLAPSARTKRSFKREVLSRGYNLIIKAMFFTRFTDAQCGFKAVSRSAARALLPAVTDNAWFFDTELLIIAEKRGFRIKEVPVRWVEDTDSRVKLVKTVRDDLRGLLRLRFGGLPKVTPPA